MKNLRMFFGSCGHTTVDELSTEDWNRANKTAEELTRAMPFGRASNDTYSVECSDGEARMVYIYPTRYCICQNCFREDFV